jgi:outer membrane lipoprotein-sorting protein
MKAVTMYFDKADMSLSGLVLEEPSGDSIRYEFSNKKFNVEVSEETFRR